VGTLVYAVAPGARDWVNGRATSIKHLVKPQKVVEVSGAVAQGSTEVAGHEASSSVDLNPLSYWQTQPQDARPTLTFTFGVPAKVSELIVRNGALDASGDYRLFRRAKQVQLVYQRADGTQKTQQITFADSSLDQISGRNVIFGQKIKLDNSAALSKLQVIVQSTYDAPAGAPLTITEIEFFVKSG
jgi:hypothetical protein